MWLPQSNALPLLGGRERIFTLHRIGGSMSPTEEGMKLGEKEDFDLVLQSGTSRNRYMVFLNGQSESLSISLGCRRDNT